MLRTREIAERYGYFENEILLIPGKKMILLISDVIDLPCAD